MYQKQHQMKSIEDTTEKSAMTDETNPGGTIHFKSIRLTKTASQFLGTASGLQKPIVSKRLIKSYEIHGKHKQTKEHI